MRILVINPIIAAYSVLGACEQDRLANLNDLRRLGHTVRLLTRASAQQNPADIEHYYAQRELPARIVPGRVARFTPRRLFNPAFLDGAAWEYATPDFVAALNDELHKWQPDLVWCHGTYTWAAAAHARQRGLPVVIRSVNYEPIHMLQEYGKSPATLLRFVGKWLGERRALRYATVLAAITPAEQRLYQAINQTINQAINRRAAVHLLPLRTLPGFLRSPQPVSARMPLRVFFMGASYNVAHNRAALDFIVHGVLPAVRAKAPGCFEFHILGAKTPQSLVPLAGPDLHVDGFVPDLDAHLAMMDIALMPSLMGLGMQQKLFESLCRGFPTITHRRALAGYPFVEGESVLTAESAQDYAQQLVRLCDPALRAQLAAGAVRQAGALFAQDRLDATMRQIVAEAARGNRAAVLTRISD